MSANDKLDSFLAGEAACLIETYEKAQGGGGGGGPVVKGQKLRHVEGYRMRGFSVTSALQEDVELDSNERAFVSEGKGVLPKGARFRFESKYARPPPTTQDPLWKCLMFDKRLSTLVKEANTKLLKRIKSKEIILGLTPCGSCVIPLRPAPRGATTGHGDSAAKKRGEILKANQQAYREIRLLVRKLANEAYTKGVCSEKLTPLISHTNRKISAKVESLPTRYEESLTLLQNDALPLSVPGYLPMRTTRGACFKKPLRAAHGVAINVYEDKRFAGVFRPSLRVLRYYVQCHAVWELVRVKRLPMRMAHEVSPPVPFTGVFSLEQLKEATTPRSVSKELMQALFTSSKIRTSGTLIYEHVADMSGHAAPLVNDVVQLALEIQAAVLPSYDALHNIATAREDVQQLCADSTVEWEPFFRSLFEYSLIVHSRTAPVTEASINDFFTSLLTWIKTEMPHRDVEVYAEHLGETKSREMKAYKARIFTNDVSEAFSTSGSPSPPRSGSGFDKTGLLFKAVGPELMHKILGEKKLNDDEFRQQPAAEDEAEEEEEVSNSEKDDLDGLLEHLAGESDASEETMKECMATFEKRTSNMELLLRNVSEQHAECTDTDSMSHPSYPDPEVPKAELTPWQIKVKQKARSDLEICWQSQRPRTAVGPPQSAHTKRPVSAALGSHLRSMKRVFASPRALSPYSKAKQRVRELEAQIRSLRDNPCARRGIEVTCRNAHAMEKVVAAEVSDMLLECDEEGARELGECFKELLQQPLRHVEAVEEGTKRREALRVARARKVSRREQLPDINMRLLQDNREEYHPVGGCTERAQAVGVVCSLRR